MLRIRPLTHAIALALAIAVTSVPAAHAKLTDENAVTDTRAAYQDLRSPDTRDAAGAYAPATANPQDLRSPDTREAASGYAPTATGHVAADTRPRSAPDGTPWGLIALAVAGAGACAAGGIAQRTRRARVSV